LRSLDETFAALLARNSDSLDAFCAIGGNMSLPKVLFERVGGFDISLVAYGGEDYEFGLRAQKLGVQFMFVPAAAGFHYSHENTSLKRYLSKARSAGRNDTDIARRHPEILHRLTLSRAERSRTWLGRVARILAFDHPRVGDTIARGLLFAGVGLVGLRLRRPWNRLVDGLYEYWYFRGVADTVGKGRAVAQFLEELRTLTPASPESVEVSSHDSELR
jgi:hypothetical protein